MIIHLRPTTPLRNYRLVDQAIEEMINDDQATSLRSGHVFEKSAYKLFKLDGEYCEFFGQKDMRGKEEYQNLPSQQLPETHDANGYIDIVLPKIFQNSNILHGKRIKAFITEKTADIDSPGDLKFCRELLEKADYSELLNMIEKLKLS
jgi:N-acylneuraminate cytidylyltransferase